MQGGTRFFLDRGVGSRVVPDGLRAAGWIVTTMDERYGREASQGIADTKVGGVLAAARIAAESRRWRVMLTLDLNPEDAWAAAVVADWDASAQTTRPLGDLRAELGL